MPSEEPAGDETLCNASNTDFTRTTEAEKDPRIIARRYQIELCKKALEENIIVYLGTGSGKTHIAVLLMYELRHLIKAPEGRVCVFLAPTVALVHQQAKVITESLDLVVGIHCGGSKSLNSHMEWEENIHRNEILVMTPETLLHPLSHSFINMNHIALLIFDECHHAQIDSSHPYAQIMRIFYANHEGDIPRIFGMTASPIVGKGAISQENLSISINSLEKLLDAKVCSVEKQNLEYYLPAPPEVSIYKYDPRSSDAAFINDYSEKIEEVKLKWLSNLLTKEDKVECLQSSKKLLSKLHDNIMYCLENLGILGALKACEILLRDGHSKWKELLESEENCDSSVGNSYLSEVSKILSNGLCGVPRAEFDKMKEPYFSTKLLCLFDLLSLSRLQSNSKCMVFVNRIIIAMCLSHILKNHKLLGFWKCDYLVGVNSGLRSMSRRNMKTILESFQADKLNLLVATKVGEEGLDIQTCCLVIRYDLPETLSSFIQSRGRARMNNSKYVFLVNSGNQKELDMMEEFSHGEERMNFAIYHRTSHGTFTCPDERVYKLSSGATVTSGYSVSLLHYYCSKLSHDEFYDPKPKFYYFDDMGLTVCHIILPSSAALHEIRSEPKLSKENAKRDACLNAIEQLHKVGALNSFLLPEKEATANERSSWSQQEATIEDDGSSSKLYEKLVPSVLKNSEIKENNVMLYSYYLEFSAVPNDRNYKDFGLFLRAPLRQDTEFSEIELHLDRGRRVITKIIPHNSSMYKWDEIVSMMRFQELYLRAILDRSEFKSEFVQLGKHDLPSNSCFHLMLPVIVQSCNSQMIIDWEIITSFLSSPIIMHLDDRKEMTVYSSSHLQLASGLTSVDDVENSLVYVPHQDKFFFVSGVVSGKTAYSHVNHLKSKFNIHLKYPEQPLLRAKQLFCMRNLLCRRGAENSEEKEEHFVDLVPELCKLKLKSFSKEMGSSVSLLPSIMHRLEGLLVAYELKCLMSKSFAEVAAITTRRILEALTTEICQESFSLERLEILGDAYLKFVVARRLFLANPFLDEGELSRIRSDYVGNENLHRMAINRNLQSYVRDQPLEPSQFCAVGRPCSSCNQETLELIHSQIPSDCQTGITEFRRCKGHHMLRKKTIADVVEALVGAFVLDSGFKAANAFLKWVGINVDCDANDLLDACIASGRCTLHAPSINVSELEKSFGYAFNHKGLLIQAFIHPSFNSGGGGCYQRLEFLGDAVLDYAVTSYLFSAYPELKPDLLTQLRSLLVNNRALAKVAIGRSFHSYIICDSSELTKHINNFVDFTGQASSSDTEVNEKPKFQKILADMVESCLGAMYLDSGTNLNMFWKIMLGLLDLNNRVLTVQLDPMQELNEICQCHKWTLSYTDKKIGKQCFVEGKINGENLCVAASGSSSNKKEATRDASALLLKKLEDLGYASISRSLDDRLKSMHKTEPFLIGYDECSVDVTEMPQVTSEEATQVVQNRSPTPEESACSQLVNICMLNTWKKPVFESVNAGKQCQSNYFACKVVVQMDDEDNTILECFGSPHTSKDMAVEHAAQSALLYIKNHCKLI